MESVREADGRSFSAVAAGIVIPVAESTTFPDPTSSTLILLLARPGPEATLLAWLHAGCTLPSKIRARNGRQVAITSV